MGNSVNVYLPFDGLWKVRNSPARRVPSHGSELFGERYAIDFVGVDGRHRTAGVTDWRTAFATEPPERFFSYGRQILSPCDGVIAAVHDGEPDHSARRSQWALVPYALGQASRIRQGIGAIAGNYVTIADSASGAFLTLVHLQPDSICVSVGQKIAVGQRLGRSGNSGNSTQPHVHVQATDSVNWEIAKGLPVAFHHYVEWISPAAPPQVKDLDIPTDGAVIEPQKCSDHS